MSSSSWGLSNFLVASFAILTLAVSARSQTYGCLPSEINPGDVVRIVTSESGSIKKISVRDSLRPLKAKCSKGKLIDGKGKEIKFFRVAGCWGNPPADYLEIQQRQQQELVALKKKYTVIEISCNTGDNPPQSIQ